MNFTREPLIETIISPKEGCKLLVRSSGGEGEEHYVDAIEVVSFGSALFFRSLERPKAFLVPASDYEVLEVKEPRVALKASTHERNIKIGGGREAPVKQLPKELHPEEEGGEILYIAEEEAASPIAQEAAPASRSDRRRDRRRRRHRRSPEEQERGKSSEGSPEGTVSEQATSVEEEVKATLPPVLPTLIPPPTTLISQTLSRYKGKEESSNPEAKAEESPAPKAEGAAPSSEEDEDFYF